MERRERAMESLGINMISVIMLTYNREQMVEKAIQSILRQTLQDFELILVDNGSTDKSGVICNKYAGEYECVKVIHKPKGNIGSGRNAGLDLAVGDYITFVDDDDWCEPDFLTMLYNLAVENSADVSICGTFKEERDSCAAPVNVDDHVIVMDAEKAIISLMWRKLYNTGFPTKLISRRLFQEICFDEIGDYDDIPLMYKILAGAKAVAYCGVPKYHVRRHDGNNSLVTTKDEMITPEYLAAYRKAYRERTNWLCKRFPNQSDYWWYFDWSFQISMVNKIISNGLEKNKMHLIEMQRELMAHKKAFMNSPHLLSFEKDWMEKYVL